MSRDEENLDDPQNDGAGYEPHSVDLSKQQQQQQQQQSQQPPHAKQPAGDAGPDEADMLFEAPPETPPSEQFGGRSQFTEGAKTKWGGHAMAADEIGIPVENEPGYMSSDDGFAIDSEQELELVEDESQLEAAAGHDVVDTSDAATAASESADAGSGLGADEDLVLDETPVEDTVYTEAAATIAAQGDAGADGEGEFFVLDEAEREADPGGSMLHEEPLPADSYPVEEGWEPFGEGADAEAEPEPAEAVSYEPDPSLLPPEQQVDEFEETYYEEAGPAVVAAAPPRRGRFVRMMASAAAAVLVVGSGAVVVLKPEWLGLHFEPQLVERVQVARPGVQSRVPMPPLPNAPRTTTPEVVQATPPPVPTDPVTADPTPPPVAMTDPAPVDPTPPQHGKPQPEEAPRYLPVGDTMWIGDFDNRKRATAEWAQVRLGAKAFAQLHNGNFFVGSVKAVNSDALLLTVQDGEVWLPRVDVDRVATLDSQEYAELQQATTGFLRLSNRNRLVGTILKSVVDDNYVLQMRSDRIVVPKALVEQVVPQPGMDGLQFDQAADEEQWLREIATQQLRAMSTGVPAAPGSESLKRPQSVPRAPEKAPKLPVKEVGRKQPVEKKSSEKSDKKGK